MEEIEITQAEADVLHELRRDLGEAKRRYTIALTQSMRARNLADVEVVDVNLDTLKIKYKKKDA